MSGAFFVVGRSEIVRRSAFAKSAGCRRVVLRVAKTSGVHKKWVFPECKFAQQICKIQDGHIAGRRPGHGVLAFFENRPKSRLLLAVEGCGSTRHSAFARPALCRRDV